MTKDAVDAEVELAKAIIESIPIQEIYRDSVKEPAKELGGIAADILKTIRLVLAPIQLTAAVQERFKKFLDESIRRVPE